MKPTSTSFPIFIQRRRRGGWAARFGPVVLVCKDMRREGTLLFSERNFVVPTCQFGPWHFALRRGG